MALLRPLLVTVLHLGSDDHFEVLNRLNFSFVKDIHIILGNTLYYNLTSDHIPDWKLLGYAVEMHSNCEFFAPLKSQYIKGKDLNSIMQYVEH